MTRPASQLVAGDVSPRLAYRWLRRQPRCLRDVYLVVEWAGTLPPRSARALHQLDLNCKTLREDEGAWGVRTRGWYGRSHLSRHGGDRDSGMEYARLLSALLRAASREGVVLWVRGDP